MQYIILLMKSLIINKNTEIKEILDINLDELYKLCGYRNNNNFVCLHTVKTNIGIIEFWGKKSKNTYIYKNLQLYGKCVILLNKETYENLTIDLFNFHFNSSIDSNNIVKVNDNDEYTKKDDNNEDDNNEDDNNEDDNNEDDNNEDNNNEDNNNEDYNEEVDNEEVDNEDDDNEDDDNEEVNPNDEDDDNNEDEDDNNEDEDDGDDNYNECVIKNQDKKTNKNSIKNIKKKDENIYDKGFINDKSKIDINDLISDELVPEVYVYTSDEDN